MSDKITTGDINSNARGTGARKSEGKARVDLLLWEDVAILLWHYRDNRSALAMHALGTFQQTHAPYSLFELIDVLYVNSGGTLEAIREAAAVLEFGAGKYKAWNWVKGMPWSVPVGCIGRHLLEMAGGQADDPESGLPHRAHVVCNVFMLLAYLRIYPEGNDLPDEALFKLPMLSTAGPTAPPEASAVNAAIDKVCELPPTPAACPHGRTVCKVCQFP